MHYFHVFHCKSTILDINYLIHLCKDLLRKIISVFRLLAIFVSSLYAAVIFNF